MCTTCMSGNRRGQKRVSDSPVGSEHVGAGNRIPSPLQEQQVILPAEPPLQATHCLLKAVGSVVMSPLSFLNLTFFCFQSVHLRC